MLAIEIKVERVPTSKLSQRKTLENIVFGSEYTDHMLLASYAKGQWNHTTIKPFGSLELMPSISALHYGQAIFEGMKAFKNRDNDKVGIFRIEDHFRRFNRSAQRLQMPKIPESIFIEGMKQLIALDRSWVPNFENHSLYIRPFMFSVDTFLGVRAAHSYYFMIIASPAARYYSKPLSIIVQEKYSRAARGGIGNIKAAGNYAAALYPTQLAIEQGYDQVLWTDAEQHNHIQEVGTMNIFFVFEDRVVTPSIEEGTILDGITRKSIIHLLRKKNLRVEESKLSIQEVFEQHKQKKLKEIFGTGTAVVINSVIKLKYKNTIIDLSGADTDTSDVVKKELLNIRYGKAEDKEGWMTWI